MISFIRRSSFGKRNVFFTQSLMLPNIFPWILPWWIYFTCLKMTSYLRPYMDAMGRRSEKITAILWTKYFFDAASSCFCRHEILFCAISTFFCWHEILFRANSTRFCRNQITFCAMSNKIIFRATPNFCFGHRL